MTPLEQFLAQINADVFLREFCFSQTTFKVDRHRKIELADHVVCIDGTWMLFQLKERKGPSDPEAMRSWFKRKVLRSATKQVRDTLHYLRGQPQITLANQQGHSHDLKATSLDEVYKVILYDPGEGRIPGVRLYHQSSSVGFIHVFEAAEYVNVCRFLITPAEIWEYLRFREQLLLRRPDFTDEAAIAGQFIAEDYDAAPDLKYRKILHRVEDTLSEFDISGLLKRFEDMIYDQVSGHSRVDYYRVIAEIAKLTRTELRAFKERFLLCVKGAQSDEVRLPYRFISPRTGCGFIFVPVPKGLTANRRNALENFTVAAKYDQELTKQIGVVVAKDGEYFLIDWMYLEGQWRFDSAIEARLKDSPPLRPLSGKQVPRYRVAGQED